MKYINPSVKIIQCNNTLQDMWQLIEYAARVCYNSTDNMSLYSEDWVRHNLIKSGHGRALEFGTVYLKVPFWRVFTLFKYLLNPWSKITHWNCVTTNYRVISENGWDKHLDWWCFTSYHKVRRYVHWEISRGIADEFRTHCSLSSLMRSTRYVLYSSKRYGEITFIKPTWFKEENHLNGLEWTREDELIESWLSAEKSYMEMCKLGSKAQEAREVLPLSLMVEFVQCGFEEDWDKFFALRAIDTERNHPHPDAMYIASQAKALLGR